MSKEELNDWVKKIYRLPFYYEPDSQIIFDQDGMVFDVRSWGRLIGIGGHQLPEKQANEVQDELGRRAAKILNEHWLKP